MRRLLCAIAADRHAAPPAPPASRLIHEHERARPALAGLHLREILFADEFRQCFPDRQEQRCRRAPPAHHPKLETGGISMIAPHNSSERFIPFEQPVQRLQLLQVFGDERPASMSMNEGPEPLSKLSGLSRDAIQLSRNSLRPQAVQHLGRHEARLLQPTQEALAAVDPVDLPVHRRGDRVQEIQAERIGGEEGGWAERRGWNDFSAMLVRSHATMHNRPEGS
jgi:hypothetical protein